MGNCVVTINLLSRRGNTKNMTWPMHCTVVREKSVTSAAEVKLGVVYQTVKTSEKHVPAGKNDHTDR